MTTRNPGQTPPPAGTKREMGRFKEGIQWEGGITPAIVVSLNGLELLGEFGAMLTSVPTRPAFVGIDVKELRADPDRIVKGITTFRQSFLAKTTALFEQSLQPKTATTYKENVSCPTIPACVILGDQLSDDALVAFGRIGAFVIDRSTPQGRDLSSFAAVYKLYTSRIVSFDKELPPVHPKKLSDAEFAELTGYPVGVKPGDLQEELDRTKQG